MSVEEVVIIGIGIVFLVLTILMGATIILGKLCQLGKSLKPAKKEEETLKEKEKLVAIVSAAIASYLSKKPNQIMINSIKQTHPNSSNEKKEK